MNCRRYERTIVLFVGGGADGELTEETRRHLESCARCQQRAVVVEKLRVSIRIHCRRVAPPAGLTERIRALLGEF